jgi:L-lysine 6-transaminase
VPKPLRLVLARDPAWTRWVGGLVVRAIGAWQRRVARKRGIRSPLTGAVTFVQRFGGLVNLNVHFHLVAPDGVCFGKKAQVCGIFASRRIDEVKDNVFARPSRINSTWGSNLVDMVRSRQFIDIILGEALHENVSARGCQLVSGLRQLQKERGGFTNVRGQGSLVAFTLETPELRSEFLRKLGERQVLALPSGTRSIRFRLPLVLTEEDANVALERVADCIPQAV